MTRFEEIAQEIGKLVSEKNKAYGDSFRKCGQFLELCYPHGIDPPQYTDALLLVRIFDKQMRIARDKKAFGESPYRDIAGYGICGTSKDEDTEPSGPVKMSDNDLEDFAEPNPCIKLSKTIDKFYDFCDEYVNDCVNPRSFNIRLSDTPEHSMFYRMPPEERS